MQVSELNTAVVERLARQGPIGPLVLSLYLDLNPSDVPTPRERGIELSGLLSGVERRAQRDDAMGRGERTGLRRDIDRLRRLFDENADLAVGAHALAVFASDPASLFEVIRLPQAVEPSATLDRSPRLLPLLAQLARGRWTVLLVSRDIARVLREDRNRLTEVATFRDDVHRSHAQGGWSQARYQRGVEKEVLDHLGRAAEAVHEELEERPFDHLIVGCSDELWPEARESLHPYLRERLRGRIDLDVERSSPDDVRRRIAPLVAASERAREREAVERLAAGLGHEGDAAAGLDDVVTALDEHRVALLLLARDARLSGAACPRCGWLSATPGSCPLDGSPLEECDALAERVAQAALRDGADVMVMHQDGAELLKRGAVGALLRF